MSNYLYLLHEEQSLNNRFYITETNEGYDVLGLENWESLISRLLDLLSAEPDQNNEREQVIRNQTINELLDLTQGTDFIFPELFFNNRSTEELIAILLLSRLKRQYTTLPKNRCPRLFISHR